MLCTQHTMHFSREEQPIMTFEQSNRHWNRNSLEMLEFGVTLHPEHVGQHILGVLIDCCVVKVT